jgi:hypothetical protein
MTAFFKIAEPVRRAADAEPKKAIGQAVPVPGPIWLRSATPRPEASQHPGNASDRVSLNMFLGKASPKKQTDRLDAEFERDYASVETIYGI